MSNVSRSIIVGMQGCTFTEEEAKEIIENVQRCTHPGMIRANSRWGLLSDRPATCTVGETYTATDVGQVFECLALNTWTARRKSMPDSSGFSSCQKCGFLEGHAKWCPMRDAQVGPTFPEGHSPRLEDVRGPFDVHGVSDVAVSDEARQAASQLRRAQTIMHLARELQGWTFTEEEGKSLLDAIATQIRPPRPGVPEGLGERKVSAEEYGAKVKAENFERDAWKHGRAEPVWPYPRGSIQSIFNYRAPRPDQLPRFQSIREGFMLTAEIILNNVPPCADRMQAIDELSRIMMLVNRAIALDGEELQV